MKYNIYTASTVSLGSRLMINGLENVESKIKSGLSMNKFSGEVILDLMNSTKVSLQMFGTGTVILLNNGTGATLSIIRLA